MSVHGEQALGYKYERGSTNHNPACEWGVPRSLWWGVPELRLSQQLPCLLVPARTQFLILSKQQGCFFFFNGKTLAAVQTGLPAEVPSSSAPEP